jgi:predicted transcriptional regulator
LQWFGGSLGLFNLRDKDKSCFRIFIALLQSAKESQKLSSDELAARTKLTRSTVVHHLNKLMSSGIVVQEKSRYSLRMDSLADMVEHIKRDSDETWGMLRDIAKDIDSKLGLL